MSSIAYCAFRSRHIARLNASPSSAYEKPVFLAKHRRTRLNALLKGFRLLAVDCDALFGQPFKFLHALIERGNDRAHLLNEKPHLPKIICLELR